MKIFFILFILTYGIFAQNNIKINKDPKLFYIQVGAFKNQQYALVILDYLNEMKYPSRIEEKQIGMDSYFKLIVGPYRTKLEAYVTKNSLPIEYTDSFILTYNNQ